MRLSPQIYDIITHVFDSERATAIFLLMFSYFLLRQLNRMAVIGVLMWLVSGSAMTQEATPVKTASPMPPASTPAATPPLQTIEELQAKIRQRLSHPELAHGRVGIKIVSLSSGKTVFEMDADKYFIPASNMKNFTVAAAIERLTPDFRFVTTVYADAKPDGDGLVQGDLRILGRGDVTISTAFNNGDYYKGIDNLVDKIAAAGVKRIEGSLVGIEGYFRGYPVPYTWEWNDLQWYYGAEVSAFPINDNAVDLNVTGGPAGTPCVISIMPRNTVMQVTNLCTSIASGGPNNLQVFKTLGKNAIELTGTLPVGGKFDGYVSVTHPADLFLEVLKQRLQLRGITITGSSRTMPPNLSPPAGQVEIARLESPPLSAIAARTMKVSQNMYTETLLWTLGEEVGRKTGMSGDSSVMGLAVVNGFLVQAGLPQKSILQYDGSGLSRHDLVTPSAVVALYRYMANQSKYAAVWRSSLSIGGVDGTLNRKFKGTAVAGNLQGKTGTLDQVSALSGYLTTAGGDQLVLSLIVNGIAEPDVRRSLIDDLVTYAAAFHGKVAQ